MTASQKALDTLRITNPARKPHPSDPRCFELAKVFLQDTTGDNQVDRMELAGQIQLVIEDFLSDLENQQDREAGYDPRNDPLDHDYSMND